ncbi:MAG: hypothetical protein K0S28_1232 [Paucimonas sp.]|nr:hypothetical protein [Paucimonas sp.]
MPPFDVIKWTIAALVFAPIVIGFAVRAPKLIALPMLAVLIMFSSSSWGQFQVENTIYSRGSGLFYFSLLNITLFIAGFGLLMRRLAYPHQDKLAPHMSMLLVGLTVLLLGHLLVGIILEVEIPVILGYSGIINVFNMLIFMYLIIASIRSNGDQKHLMWTIIGLALVRAIYGLVRYQFFGGDSANPYRNFEGMDIKLVYFDIADNFIASLGAFWAAWMLTTKEFRLSVARRVWLYAFLALEVATVALSFRRSSLIGLVLMFVFLLFRLPGKQRAKFLLIAAAIVAATVGVFFEQRLQHADKSGGDPLTSLIYDFAPKKGQSQSSNRSYELIAAARSLEGNWLTGLGTWGVFTGDQEVLSYHQGRMDFIHSGFGHVLLKTGIIGFLLFCGIFWKYVSYYRQHCAQLRGRPRLIADAGFAGFLFWIPTLLIGTPVIEFRSMMLIGLTLALPFVAVRLHKQYWSSYAAA